MAIVSDRYIKSWLLSSVIVAMAILQGCIKNDIPYPRIQPNFLSINAEGQSQKSSIDTVNRVVTMYFPENINIYDIKITDYSITPGSEILGDGITGGLDLENPVSVTLRFYQDYLWTIKGVQDIQRYFTVANQIGSSYIDVPGRRVVAYVPESTDLGNLLVETMKLGPEGSVTEPDLEGHRIDFTYPVKVNISSYGHIRDWTIYIEKTESPVTTSGADAWTRVAWVYGEAEAGKDNGIEYRLKGDDVWTKVPDDWLTVNGGSFYARIIHLDPSTTYETRAFSDEDYGQILEFTTGEELQVPNSGFDNWWLDGKVWNPWKEGDDSYWDTGNKGATTLGASNTVPTEDTPAGSGYAAKLETKFVGIGAIGKLASGNLFAGKYVRTDGTNGILDFGREFDMRPTKLRGYMKYATAPISSTTAGFSELKGRPDTCIIWVALIDQDKPFEIRTNPNNRQLFDPEDPMVIAYGKVESGSDIPDYVQFEIELDYRATDRRPKYILITASASKYGDYFTGGNGSVLYIDDFELIYDY